MTDQIMSIEPRTCSVSLSDLRDMFLLARNTPGLDMPKIEVILDGKITF